MAAIAKERGAIDLTDVRSARRMIDHRRSPAGIEANTGTDADTAVGCVRHDA
jgi:hypothetical protein